MHFSPEPAFQNSNICYRYRFRCHQFCPCWCLPESIVTDIPHELLMYFTSKTDDTYVINSRIREMVTFANHNFIKDPPFSKLDVVSCRNLLIYLEPVLQKKTHTAFSLYTKSGRISCSRKLRDCRGVYSPVFSRG